MEWLEPSEWKKERLYHIKGGEFSLLPFDRCSSLAEVALSLKWGNPVEFSQGQVLDPGDFGRRLIGIVKGDKSLQVIPRSEGLRGRLGELLSGIRFGEYREKFLSFLKQGVENLDKGFKAFNTLKVEGRLAKGLTYFHVYAVLDVERGVLSGITKDLGDIRGRKIEQNQIRILLEVSKWSRSGNSNWTILAFAPEKSFHFLTEEARRVFEASIALFNLGKRREDFKGEVQVGNARHPGGMDKLFVPPPPQTPHPSRPPAWAR